MFLEGPALYDRRPAGRPRDLGAPRPGALRNAPPASQPGPNRIRNEVILLTASLACGLLVVPVVFWFAARPVLGDYTPAQNTHPAGPMVLLHDFFTGLARGSPVFWVVALGPAVMLAFARLAYSLLRPRSA
jgi:hypothetical protein